MRYFNTIHHRRFSRYSSFFGIKHLIGKRKMKCNKKKTALIYDFDGTLAPGNLQEHSFIPDIGMSKEESKTTG